MSEAVLKSRLRVHRVLSNLTQEDLAQKIGVSRQTVGAMEKGEYAPSVTLAIRLARTLACAVEDIFDEVDGAE